MEQPMDTDVAEEASKSETETEKSEVTNNDNEPDEAKDEKDEKTEEHQTNSESMNVENVQEVDDDDIHEVDSAEKTEDNNRELPAAVDNNAEVKDSKAVAISDGNKADISGIKEAEAVDHKDTGISGSKEGETSDSKENSEPKYVVEESVTIKETETESAKSESASQHQTEKQNDVVKDMKSDTVLDSSSKHQDPTENEKDNLKDAKTSNVPGSSSIEQDDAEKSEEIVEDKNADTVDDSSPLDQKKSNIESIRSIPSPKGDTYEDSLTELKMIFEQKTKKDNQTPEQSPTKTNKSTYESQFEKFLLQANTGEKTASDAEQDSNNDSSRSTNKEKEELKSSNMNFKVISDETSNSSWYKIGSNAEQPMEISGPVNQEDISNLSVPDNASVVSSNIGDSCMSFQDQGSNFDECSNLSVPEDSATVEKYTGHEPVLDESANMNPPSNVTFQRPDTPSSVINDTTSESTPAKKTRRGTLQIAVDDASQHGHNMTAADIFEYQWPVEKDAEYYILQEQISIYLDIKSFKRKYSELFRRVCDKHEKDFLREKGVVSETQSDLGLTALKSDEVHDLMSRDYPAKYKEYLKVIHEKERQRMAIKMKEHDALKLEKDKMIEYTKRAMKSASDWNRQLLKERNEERRAYFDTQTFSIQYPRNKFRKLEKVETGVTAYPLSLIPGQFQDYYRRYNSEELKYFPLNTTLFDPPKKLDIVARQRQLQQMEDEAESQEDAPTGTGSVSESDSDDSSSSSSSDESESKENGDVGRNNNNANAKVVKKKEKSTSRETSKEKSVEVQGNVSQSLQPVVKLELMECRICKEDKGKSKVKVEEELIRCSECKSTGHPSCLDLTDEMVKIIKTYPWQCMECKTCVQCMDPYDEDKMMFCDKCDRGYHTFCVGLKSLPTGHWECKSCLGDSTPVKPIPRPTPKPKRGPGRPRLYDKDKEESSPGKDKPPAKESPARDRPERIRSTPSRLLNRDVKDKPAGLRDKTPKGDKSVSRESSRAVSRESSRSSLKDSDN